MQAVCSWECGLVIAKLNREHQEAVEHRRRVKQAKTRLELMAEAQAAVNRYVRLRDRDDGCISCGLGPNWGGQWHAGHLRTVAAASAVRFNLWGINRQCSGCNNFRSGNLEQYRPRLIAKIGQDKVDWLLAQNQRVVYSREYLIRLKKVFAKKARRLERNANDG